MTFDTDYADLLFRQRLAPPPALLLLRVPHYRAVEPASWIVPLVQNPTEYEGLFCVVPRDRVRKRPFLRLTGDGSDA